MIIIIIIIIIIKNNNNNYHHHYHRHHHYYYHYYYRSWNAPFFESSFALLTSQPDEDNPGSFACCSSST